MTDALLTILIWTGLLAGIAVGAAVVSALFIIMWENIRGFMRDGRE